MTKGIVDWDVEAAIEQSFMEANEQAEAEAYERHLKWLENLIENRDRECAREQDKKITRQEAKRQKQAIKHFYESYWDD